MKAANNEIRMGGGVKGWCIGTMTIYIGHPNHLQSCAFFTLTWMYTITKYDGTCMCALQIA